MLKRGKPVAITWPITYGSHPWHHYGMPGTVIVEEGNLKRYLLDVMLGLWNMGYRKQIMVNNHGHFWVLEATVQEFMKRYQLPGIYRALDWHRCARKFFRTKERGGDLETDFVHADESETSLALLLIPQMVEMRYAVDTQPRGYLPDGHLDKAVDGLMRPSKWSDGQGHMPIEIFNTPEGVVGRATLGEAKKVKRAVAFFLKYLTLLIDEILEAFPPGKVPPTEEVTFRTREELEPYVKRPLTEGWKPVYKLIKKL
jgi:creatinine amidohydrolase